MWLQLLILLLWTATLLLANAPVFTVQPVSINTTDGTVEAFTCKANGSLLVYVNNVEATDTSVTSKGFMQTSETLSDGSRIATLTVTASSSLNNNSMIQCIAVGSPNTDSDEVILRIQGPLSSVVDLSYSFINSSTVNISWSPPFTLPGTDITGYNISAFTDEPKIEQSFTELPFYELSLSDITNSSQFRIYVNVSGYNGLNGESTVLDGPLFLPGVPITSRTTISLTHRINNNLQLTLSINASDLFPGECPTRINMTLSSSNGVNTNISDIPLSTCTEQSRILTRTITSIVFTWYLSYTAIVSYYNLAGSFDVTNTFSFNTYDLVSVCVLNSSDSRVCLECSFSSFSTDNAGCTVELVSSTSSTLTYNETFSKPNPNSDDVEGCIDGINTGQYSITVYGGNRPPVLIPELTITGTLIPMENITTFTTTTTSVTDNMSPTLSMDTEANNSSGRSSITIIIITIIAVVIVLVFITLIVNIVLVIIDRKKNKKSIILHHPSNDIHMSPTKEKCFL